MLNFALDLLAGYWLSRKFQNKFALIGFSFVMGIITTIMALLITLLIFGPFIEGLDAGETAKRYVLRMPIHMLVTPLMALILSKWHSPTKRQQKSKVDSLTS